MPLTRGEYRSTGQRQRKLSARDNSTKSPISEAPYFDWKQEWSSNGSRAKELKARALVNQFFLPSFSLSLSLSFCLSLF